MEIVAQVRIVARDRGPGTSLALGWQQLPYLHLNIHNSYFGHSRSDKEIAELVRR